MDVCPLLEPSPSTPSGDYVQPVNVARDIELQTRNLPAPVSFNICYLLHPYYYLLSIQISGFSYICSLGGTVNLPSVYSNESSLTCRVNQDQVMYWGMTHKWNEKLVFIVYILVLCKPPQISSSSSTGRENVTISIVWEIPSSGRQHPIDLLTPVNSECILVSILFTMTIVEACVCSLQCFCTTAPQ